MFFCGLANPPANLGAARGGQDDVGALAGTASTFSLCGTAVVDPRAVFLSEDAGGEQRFIAIGLSELTRILFMVHVDRGQRDRIISARVATDLEEAIYAQGG